MTTDKLLAGAFAAGIALLLAAVFLANLAVFVAGGLLVLAVVLGGPLLEAGRDVRAGDRR